MVGEPDAGNPQVRFDEGTQETYSNVARLRPTLPGAPQGRDRPAIKSPAWYAAPNELGYGGATCAKGKPH